MLRNGLFMRIQTKCIGSRILRTAERYRGRDYLQSDRPQLPASTILVDAFGSLSLTSGLGIG
ncbi:MAG: hypothetical protein DMF02_04825 [Verrucomicrobia bacterium]|nr:MAG: hypothetical protein DMF02_04825 [Verrucomicrobiota bacterium]